MNTRRVAAQKTKRNRDMLEITGVLLLLATVRISRTRMMSRANLSYKQANTYLELLINRRLIEEVDAKGPTYRVTERGREFIAYYDAMATLLDGPADTHAQGHTRRHGDREVI